MISQFEDEASFNLIDLLRSDQPDRVGTVRGRRQAVFRLFVSTVTSTDPPDNLRQLLTVGSFVSLSWKAGRMACLGSSTYKKHVCQVEKAVAK